MASIYFSHYCREHLIPYNWEALARAWNAGPDWEQNKKATDAYWEKVRKLLVQKRQDIVDAHGAVAEGTEEVPEK
jgi:hypothetical protein